MKYLLFLFLSFSCFAKPNTIWMINMKFSQKILEIDKNDTVIFLNKDSILHNVVENNNHFRSKMLRMNDTFTVKFRFKGVYHYHCEPHRNMGMVGTIIVK